MTEEERKALHDEWLACQYVLCETCSLPEYDKALERSIEIETLLERAEQL